MPIAFTVPREQRYRDIGADTYEEILSLVKKRRPNATEIAEDGELCDLHDLLIILKMGYLKVYHCECGTDEEVMVLEICEPENVRYKSKGT